MNEQTKVITQETPEKEEFIMLPTVDFCFKELMQNAKVRQGMIAALLGVEPRKSREQNYFQQYYTQNLLEIHVLELEKIAERRTG